MKNTTLSRLIAALMLLLFASTTADAQNQPSDPECDFLITGDIIPRSAFITYGSGLKMKSQNRRTKLTIGQTVVGSAFGPQNNSTFGYWAGFLVAPFPPFVKATQGELLDRIQISWAANPLGPFANEGFKIYRDGVYLAQVDKNTRNYNDFNVIAGRPYNYEVRGINAYGEGSSGHALGFQVPNGVVTGWVRTLNDNPVPNALVTLMPMQGFSAFFDPQDGAFAVPDTSTDFNFMPLSDSDWSMTFWLKTDQAAGDPLFFAMTPQTFTIRALNSNGVSVSVGGATLSGNFGSPADQWHHVMIGYSDGRYRLYLDGLLASINNGTALLQSEGLHLGKRASNDNWQGRLDELRIYHKRLDELDLPEIMEGTASSLTEGLKYYWKMDEEQGTKSFDVLNRAPLFFCGAAFSDDRPPVRTSGMTNEDGYYRIESASYGTGITFLAEPMKSFYAHRALKFTRAEADYATLPDFSLTPKATLETWINSAGPDGLQNVLSKRWAGGNTFQLQLQPAGTDNEIIVRINNQAHNFGLLGIGYHHLAFIIDSTGGNTLITAYKDGVSLGSAALPPVTGNWSDPTEPWVLGARRSGNVYVDHYGGLIDEVALYDTILPPATITAHAGASRNPQERGLRIYFALDEGNGSRLNNSGSVLLNERGTTFGTEWTIMAPNQETTPHEFAPSTRQVTLNPSITSVDQVDFTDRSTIPVTGFVRYKNTDCFAENVEILVNDAPFNPRIFTDSTGKFVIDLEPGATVTLTPVFEDHQFNPAFWDLTNIVSPVAGIVFNDITTRSIDGYIAGGDCKLPIIDSLTVCLVKVQSLDGCFEKIQQVTNVDGEYAFPELPPIELTVAIIEHSDPVIKNAFQVLGGKQVDLTKRDTSLDFIYYAPPQVEITGLPPNDVCPDIIVLEQYVQYTMVITMQEYYLGEGCPLDTGNIRIINDVAGSVVDTVMSNTTLLNKFRAGIVNSSPPFFQNIQVIGKSIQGNESSTTVQVLVTGLFAKSNTFTTQLPLPPTLVLRDPPGDGSYSYFEKGKTVCQSVSMSLETTGGFGATGVLDVAPNFGVEVGPVSIELGGVVGPEITRTTSLTKLTDNSMEVCQTFSETISTSSSDLIVGPAYNVPFLNPPPGDGWIQGGDLFVGSGLNVDFGFADRVEFDTTLCEGMASTVVSISPKNYGTTYMYTEYHIRNNVMRYLQAIADDPNTTPEKRDTCLTSINRWNEILNNNQQLINAAKFRRNVSFDSGIEYEYSETSDTTTSTTSGTATTSVFNTDISILAIAAGVVGGAIIHVINENVRGSETGSSSASSITTGFVLADDDPGDAFSIDIAMDSVYKTPVFRTVSGQSSCPWEPKTAHREGNSLEFRDGSGAIAVDVPSNEAAVFKFTLGNQSETNETWTYAFTAGPESNPHGAKIFLNGAALDHPVLYAIPYGESVPITLTVERGPEEYIYDSLEVVFYSLCEDDRANALGILPDLDTILYSAQYISVHFIKPCSEVEINVPEQDWVLFPDPITPGPDDIRRITVSGYDKSNDEFEKIRVQYRRSDGDGAWINIVPPVDPAINAIQPGGEIEKANLGNVFTQFYWDTDGLSDGPYEIRAVALCTGDASDKPGISHVIKGRIERQPPSLIGVPQPSDGVYQVGDEISFSFNKQINCSKINPVDNVLLFDATTDLPIDIDITCYENKIILDPNFQNQFFENRILRAEIHDIEDLTGNSLDFEKWEFYVDRNELAWLTDSAGMTKFEDETKTITANIHNRGGYPVPFSIENIPHWVHVVPTQGTLAPNEIRPVSFTVDSTLAFGLWADSIVLHTETGQNPFFMGGDEGLPFGVRVVCRPPDWNLNVSLFENSENMVLELNIEGEISNDVEDMVVAYIGDTLCGRARVQYVPQVDKYLAYLTIYGNPNHVLQPLRLEIWDASACLRYEVEEDYFVFQPDDVIGDPLSPQVIHTNSNVLREVPLGFGWNWISFNLEFPDPAINAALSSLSSPANDLMKGQNLFSVYLDGGGWIGSLNTLENTTMYIYRANTADTLQIAGNALDPANTPIPVVAGWNWIGYIPNYSLPINEALSSLPAATGDLIKSQTSFAQYINPDFGWIGNLKFMQPPQGYQIKLSSAGTLVYPPFSANRDHLNAAPYAASSSRGPENGPAYWTVDPTQFEHSMTLIGMLQTGGENGTTGNMELGAFSGTDTRGSAQAIYVAPLQSYLFFLTVYANGSGDQIRYKLYDSSNGQVQDLNEWMFFSPDLHQGSIQSPIPFTLPSSGVQEAMIQTFDIDPNPFHTETVIRYALAKAQEVRVIITDVGGKVVAQIRNDAQSGVNAMVWKSRTEDGTTLPAGVYFVRLQTETGSVVKKVVLN
jgi:hypothetical protein